MKININTGPNVRIASNEEIIKELEARYVEIQREIENFITFANHYEFPSIGDPKTLYIATDEEVIYYWADQYIALTGIDALNRQVAEINGGGSLNGE